MTETVNLLDVVGGAGQAPLELVRLGGDETAVVPFTSNGDHVWIHFCDEPEIGAYVLCNGRDCVLCRVGKKRDERVLIPVFLPATGCIGVLPVSPSLRPNALLPQLAPVFTAPKPTVAFIRREGAKFTTSVKELPEDANAGEAAVKQFLEDQKGGRISLSSVYQAIPNEQLAVVNQIATLMRLKGIGER